MMTVTILLAMGVALLVGVTLVVFHSYADVDDTFTPCDMYSPDGSAQCDDFIGHTGWCGTNDGLQWSGDVWNIGFFDDTRQNRAALAPTLIQPVTNPKPKHRQRRNWKLWAAIFAAGIGLGALAQPAEKTEPAKSAVQDCGTSKDFRYFGSGCPGHKSSLMSP